MDRIELFPLSSHTINALRLDLLLTFPKNTPELSYCKMCTSNANFMFDDKVLCSKFLYKYLRCSTTLQGQHVELEHG